ncbi:hypothetical protein ABFS83_04G117200 [Erythranthe nasuta]
MMNRKTGKRRKTQRRNSRISSQDYIEDPEFENNNPFFISRSSIHTIHINQQNKCFIKENHTQCKLLQFSIYLLDFGIGGEFLRSLSSMHLSTAYAESFFITENSSNKNSLVKFPPR